MEIAVVNEVWPEVLAAVRERCTTAQFQTWFSRLLPSAPTDDDSNGDSGAADRPIEIRVPNRFLLDGIVRKNLAPILEAALRDVTGRDCGLTFLVDESLSKKPDAVPSEAEWVDLASENPAAEGSGGCATVAEGPPKGLESAVSGASDGSSGPTGSAGATPTATPSAPASDSSAPARPASPFRSPTRPARPPQGDVLASSESDLNPNYSFQNFIVGPSNRVPHAAALAVVSSPGTAYNPLFLHGSVGLGKTHLLQAICHALLQKKMIHRFLYLSCETFVNHFISAIENGKLDDFRYLYRHVDMLLIDDVQFLSKKERTQEEFFHTFNTLYNSQKQIVLTCDSPPSELQSIQERLVSRFNWGLVTHLQLPDYETRVAIIKNKAALSEFDLPEDVAHYTAERIQSNIRDLEGAITKIVAYARLTRRKADLALAREAFQDLPDRRSSGPDIRDIIATVTTHFGVSQADLESKRRLKTISFPRQVCMYLTRELTEMSLEEIGSHFGKRDHTTVLYAIEKIRNLLAKDHDLGYLLEDLTQRIVRRRP